MNRLIVCKECQHRFPDNPAKHRNRPKLCPRCLQPYTKQWFKWKPNLNWIRTRLNTVLHRRAERETRMRQQVTKSLRMSYGREPTEEEITWGIMRRRTEIDEAKFKGRPR